MLNSGTIQVLAILALPYALQYVGSIFRRRNNASQNQKLPGIQRPPPPLNPFLYPTVLLLALAALSFFVFAFLPQSNIFQALGLPVDAPNFVVQQVWREHVLQNNQFAVQYSEELRDRLRVIQNRKLYRAFGHDTFVECDFCSEIMDYYYFILPMMIGAYVGMGALLGLATVFPRMDRYRVWGCALLVLVFVFELSMINDALERSESTKIMPDRHKNLAGSTGGTIVRYFVFAIMSLVLSIILYRSKTASDKRETEDILRDIVAAQESILQRQRVLKLAKAASTTDPVLRQKFIDSWKRRDIEQSILLADPEYQSARNLALARIDVATVTKETEEYIDNVLAANRMDQLLGLNMDDDNASSTPGSNDASDIKRAN
ncbi:hypothetical protein BGW42_005738 [Actinomortierella wolfii]|nr:hypothetical protein BGW42_005738 [Actinomortierella wolfii]